MRYLIIVRGLSGSGKTTAAGLLDGPCFSADDYFMRGGEYHFDPRLLPEAHAQCQLLTKESLSSGQPITVVANTFSSRWEMQPYFDLARHAGVRVTVLDIFDGGMTNQELFEQNVHGVPLATIENMRSRWEHDWKVGNPVPPWERGDDGAATTGS